ncbi:MAG: hypothetical protein ACE5KA_08270 [Nitrososphaerales archaeon]
MYQYNVHDIAKLRSAVRLHELEYFLCNSVSNPDVVIDVADSFGSGLSVSRSLIADDVPKKNKVKYTEHLGPLGAQFAIDFSYPLTITVNNLISRSRHVLYVNLVEPIMRFIMISKGYVLLHSACMSLDGQGILLSAPPDTGKTTTVLKCVNDGFSFLSDDMTIIRLPDTAMCFPKPMTVSAHTLRTAVNVSNNKLDGVGLKLRSLVHSKGGRGLMRKLGKFNMPIFTINTVGQSIVKPPKFSIENLLKNVSILDKTKVTGLYFLQRGGEETINLYNGIATKRAIENSDDAFLFPPYKEMLQYININGKSAHDLLEEEREILEKFLCNINCAILKSESRSWDQMVNRIAYGNLA